jgi:4-oxalocrotonate tautomerase
MPIIHVNMLKGRSDAQKRRLARGITDVVAESIGVSRDAVRVLIHEVDPAHWFAGGESKAPLAGQNPTGPS